jgi:hypothetical protein
MRKPRVSGAFFEVSDGTRTRDRLDHNQELYLLSYAHHGDGRNVAAGWGLATAVERLAQAPSAAQREAV